MKQFRIFKIILLCFLIKQLEGKATQEENQRVKRGYSKYGENEYGSTIHVSSGVLQYGQPEEPAHLDVGSHYEALSVNDDPWQASGISAGYDVWLEPPSSYHPSSSMPDIHAPSIPSSHPGSDFMANSVFSDDTIHSAPSPASQLHTQIIGSSSSSSSSGSSSGSIHDLDDHHSISTISDNIDFGNVADIKTKHYSKSYGK